MCAYAGRQAGLLTNAEVTHRANPVVQVIGQVGATAVAADAAWVKMQVLVTPKKLGLGSFLGHGRSRDEQDNYSENEQAAHISSCERIMLGMLTIIAGIATAIQGVFDSSFLLVNRAGRSAGDASIREACSCPSVWPQIALSLYEFGLLALRPWVIGQRELHAIRDGRMRIKQEDGHGIGLRIRQVHVAKNLKRLCRHLVRIRRESVGDLEAILVGLMFIVAAARAGDGARNERKDGEEQQQGWQRRPIVEAADSPFRAPAGKHPADAAIAEIEEHEQEHGAESEQLGDMLQDVMAHLMAGDVNDLRSAHFGDGGIKYDHALRGPETSHVGVQRRRLLGRAHPEHALRGDVFSRVLHHPFKAGSEGGILLLQRLEFEKQRSNDERLDEEQE